MGLTGSMFIEVAGFYGGPGLNESPLSQIVSVGELAATLGVNVTRNGPGLCNKISIIMNIKVEQYRTT